jgi:hypothetical protein
LGLETGLLCGAARQICVLFTILYVAPPGATPDKLAARILWGEKK